MHPVLLYRPDERLSASELSAARLDGDVVEVGDGYMPADTVEDAAARASGIAELVPPGTAVSGISAAWVHGAGDRPPIVHHVTRISPRRQRLLVSARVVHHERLLGTDEVQLLAGVPVATAASTALSLLFSSARDGADERWLRALLQVRPDLHDVLRARLARLTRRPGLQHARRLLAEMRPGATGGIRTW